MNTENEDRNRAESARVYARIIADMEAKFPWIDLAEAREDRLCEGLPTVLLDLYISEQVLERVAEDGEAGELREFFNYVESVLQGADALMIECFETTFLEKLVAERRNKVASVLPMCGEKTKKRIGDAMERFKLEHHNR